MMATLITDFSPESQAVTISGEDDLLSRGVCRCEIPASLKAFSEELSEVTPESIFAEDNEYAQYRNIMEHETFPFDDVLRAITPCLTAHFVGSVDELRLDDAFAIHYNEQHFDTTVKKHTDPSDITVNMCISRSEELEGSQVLFFGNEKLVGSSDLPSPSSVDSNVLEDGAKGCFLVTPQAGWATVHWGKHPHLVTSLKKGQRTNVVMTYCFSDKSKSRSMKSDCFQDETLK